MSTRTTTRFLSVAWLAVLPAAGCVSSELEAPANHPGHAKARPGKLTLAKALGPEHDVRVETGEGDGAPSSAGHDGHQGHDGHTTGGTPSKPGTAPSQSAASSTTEKETGVTYVCPMHPEIVRKEPGTCPICGMKLVPEKAKP